MQREVDEFLGLTSKKQIQTELENACSEGNVNMVFWILKYHSHCVSFETPLSKACFQQKILKLYTQMNLKLLEDYTTILYAIDKYNPKYCLWCSHFGKLHKNEI